MTFVREIVLTRKLPRSDTRADNSQTRVTRIEISQSFRAATMSHSTRATSLSTSVGG